MIKKRHSTNNKSKIKTKFDIKQSEQLATEEQADQKKKKNLFLQALVRTFGLTMLSFFAVILLIFIIAWIRG